MSNSFNISVKPEIAAVKADTADIRSDVTAIHDTNLPAVKSDTGDIRTDVTAIHDTDLPAAVTKIDANKSVVDLIRGTDVPNIQTNIDANETKIDAIQPLPFYWVIVSDTVLNSALTERNNATTSYVKVKEIKVFFAGSYRITFDLKVDGVADSSGRIYKSGVAHGTERTTNSLTYVNYSEDLVFAAYDLIQLYIKTNYVGRASFTENFIIKGTIIATPTLLITD